MDKNLEIKSQWLAVVLLTAVSPGLAAADELPQTTADGMELRKQTDSRVVYAMPGATLEPYSKVMLVDAYVAFEKDWEKDYNRTTTFGNRISTKDMDRIKSDLAAEFRKVFTEQLTKAGHEVVESAGPGVLLIRPAIINLDVAAPDTMSSGFSRVIVDSAGAMTLYMELYDSETSALMARVMDAQADDRGFATSATRGTNRQAADRILRSWADELATHLSEVKETGEMAAGDNAEAED